MAYDRGQRPPEKSDSSQQRRASGIMRGLSIIMPLAVVLLGAYKLPILAFQLGWIDTPPSWYTPPRASPEDIIYRTPDGREYTRAQVEQIRSRADNAAQTCHRLYDRAVAKYEDQQLVDAILDMTQAQHIIGPVADSLEEMRGLQLFEGHIKPVDRLVTDIGLKVAQWRRELTVVQAHELLRRLKKAGLSAPTVDSRPIPR